MEFSLWAGTVQGRIFPNDIQVFILISSSCFSFSSVFQFVHEPVAAAIMGSEVTSAKEVC